MAAETTTAPPAPPVEPRIAQLPSGWLAYRVVGSGPPLILVHGLGGSGRWWDGNLPRLSRHFTVYVVDLMGFGDSARQPFVLDQASAQLAAWIEALGLPSVRLVGHSMGGLICADLAADRPELVERLILVDAAALPFEWGLRRHILNGLRAVPTTSMRFLPMAIADTLRAGPLTMIRALRAVIAADLRRKLGRIKAPTLVLWGELDPLIPTDTGRRLAAAIPRARFAVIRGAGHSPMFEQLDAFDESVLAFLLAPRVGRSRQGRLRRFRNRRSAAAAVSA
jgi:pimeloyl-ACP methyl ester carboxylesterase